MPHCAALLGAGGLSQGQGSVPMSQPYLCQMRPEEGWSEEGRVAKEESREVQPFKRREKYQVTNRSKELKRRVMNLGENHSNHRSLHVRHSQGEKKKKKRDGNGISTQQLHILSPVFSAVNTKEERQTPKTNTTPSVWLC